MAEIKCSICGSNGPSDFMVAYLECAECGKSFCCAVKVVEHFSKEHPEVLEELDQTRIIDGGEA